MESKDDRLTRGQEIRTRIMGGGWVSSATVSPGLAAFTERAVDHVWSTVWTDPAMPLPMKSTVTLSVLIAQGHLDEFEAHAAGALRAGLLDAATLRAIVLHALPYVGFPAARHAMATLDGAIAEVEGAR